MESVIKIVKIIFDISLLLYIFSTYFGIVGFTEPNLIIQWCNLISLTTLIVSSIIYYILSFINDLRTKDKDIKENKSKERIAVDYILPFIMVICVYLWSHYVVGRVPIYGEHITYNPLSLLGFGPKFVGKKMERLNQNETRLKNNSPCDYNPTNYSKEYVWYTRIITTIISVISSILYLFGAEWLINSDMMTILVGNTGTRLMGTLLLRTLFKMILGYVPCNNQLKEKYPDNYLMKFVQYRVASDTILSKIASVYRKWLLVGLDLPTVDVIFDTPSYNEISKKFNRFTPGSFIYNYVKDYLPFVWNWIKYAFIGYTLAIILIVIRIFIK